MDRGLDTGRIGVSPDAARRGRRGMGVWLIPLLILIPLFYYPLGTVLVNALTGQTGRVSASPMIQLLRDPYIRRIIGFTLLQATLSTLVSLALGLPGAYLLAHHDFPGKALVRSATLLPFVLPSILVVLGFVQFFGRGGVLNQLLMTLLDLETPPIRVLYSLRGILLAHAFYNFPICVRVVSSLWSRINPHLEEAARTLGARGPRLFWRVTLPQILPGILSSGALIFLFCFLSFAVVLVLGGGPRFTTLEVEIYRLARVNLDLGKATSLAMIGSVLTLAVLWLYLRLQRWATFSQSLSTARNPAKPANSRHRWFTLLYLTVVGLLVAGPLVTVVARSLMRRDGWSGMSGFTTEWYRQILVGTTTRFGSSYRQAVVNSVFFGLATTALAAPLGTLIAWLATRRRFRGSSWVEALLMLPMGMSSIVLGLAYITALRDLPVTTGWYAVVLAHVVIAYPFVVRSVGSVIGKISPSIIDASRSLGAGTLRVFWHIELPLIRSGILTGAAFAFAISMGEINATLLLSDTRTVTIPIAIYRLIGSYNYFAACAMGTILMVVALLAILLIETPERIR